MQQQCRASGPFRRQPRGRRRRRCPGSGPPRAARRHRSCPVRRHCRRRRPRRWCRRRHHRRRRRRRRCSWRRAAPRWRRRRRRRCRGRGAPRAGATAGRATETTRAVRRVGARLAAVGALLAHVQRQDVARDDRDGLRDRGAGAARGKAAVGRRGGTAAATGAADRGDVEGGDVRGNREDGRVTREVVGAGVGGAKVPVPRRGGSRRKVRRRCRPRRPARPPWGPGRLPAAIHERARRVVLRLIGVPLRRSRDALEGRSGAPWGSPNSLVRTHRVSRSVPESADDETTGKAH